MTVNVNVHVDVNEIGDVDVGANLHVDAIYMLMMMVMMTHGGAVCPVRNETGSTGYKNVAAPKTVA